MLKNFGFKAGIDKIMHGCFESNKKSLMDRTTKLPTLISIFPELNRIMSNIAIGMIYIDLTGFKEIEILYGRSICSKILYNSASALQKMQIDFYGQRSIMAACSIGGDDFAIFMEGPGVMDDFEQAYMALKRQIENNINEANRSLGLNQVLQVHMGYAALRKIPDYHIESLVYKAIKEATYMAKQYDQACEHASWHSLKNILEQRSVDILYQPIVSLKSGDCLGLEALSRGPAGTVLEAPAKLFRDAERFRCLLELETLCHEIAVSKAANHLAQRYLFLNVTPSVLSSGNYHKGLSKEMLRLYGISFSNVVLELTERNGIEDYRHFREVLLYYRRLGFMIAIDDAGAGYSSLQAIAELQPEFVKIDMSLVQGVDKNPTKKALLETFVDFSYKIGARIIGEGIETEGELTTLAAMGCDYGQGFLLARPGSLNQEIEPHIREKILLSSRSGHLFQNEPSKIGDIAMYNNSIACKMPVEEVIEIFNNNKSINGLVICEDDIPAGLIMRDRLFARLGSRYGYDLFIRRPIEDLMDRHPLILPWFTSLEEAARQVAERLDQGITDYIVVSREQRYSGVVSTAKMLDTMAKLQIDQAKDANPLTGLPGNRCITRTISDALRIAGDISVLYFDLDNFKAFNDYYGFAEGDRALALLAQVLVDVVETWGNNDDLVGHIGGDDFVVITSSEKADRIAADTMARFDRQITELYDQASLEQGYIIAADRRGQVRHFPIMSLSIARVSNNASRNYENHLQLGEAAAELKKIAKAQKGSAYISDQHVNI